MWIWATARQELTLFSFPLQILRPTPFLIHRLLPRGLLTDRHAIAMATRNANIAVNKPSRTMKTAQMI
jgi:hypothetical protein